MDYKLLANLGTPEKPLEDMNKKTEFILLNLKLVGEFPVKNILFR
jgi:hypothetical protein